MNTSYSASSSSSHPAAPAVMNISEPYRRTGAAPSTTNTTMETTVPTERTTAHAAPCAHPYEDASTDPAKGSLAKEVVFTSPAAAPPLAHYGEAPEGDEEDTASRRPPSATTTEADFDEVERRARIALEHIATREEDVEHHMVAYIHTLQVYRAACQERAMYREAHLVQQVLSNLRMEEETRHVRGLTERQMEERRMLEEAHREQFREFHHTWNARINAFEEEQLNQEISLMERQNEELLAFQEEMRDYDPRLPKYSRQLLDTRAKQHTLARQRNYAGAQIEKTKGDAVELMDMERFEEARALSFERREYTLRHRHQQELFALRTKVESRRLYLEKCRKQELDVLLQRYINLRRAMESQQNVVRSRTGALLLKHACNTKSDVSASAALVESAGNGTFGSVVQRRQADEMRASQQRESQRESTI